MRADRVFKSFPQIHRADDASISIDQSLSSSGCAEEIDLFLTLPMKVCVEFQSLIDLPAQGGQEIPFFER